LGRMTCEDKVLYKHLVIQRATWIDPSKMPQKSPLMGAFLYTFTHAI
jgi:hypothetical protein